MTSGGKWKRRKAAGRVEQGMARDSGTLRPGPDSVPATEPVDLYVQPGFDFADAYLIAAAEDRGLAEVVSFDRFDAKLRRSSKVHRREP